MCGMKKLFCMITLLAAVVACGAKAKSAEAEAAAETDVATEAEKAISAKEVVADGDESKAAYIIISKQDFTLSLYDSDDRLVCRFPVAVGKYYGNKQRSGDMKTPEGDFSIQQIQPASDWGHDFGDGKGWIPNCYGNWFIRLKTPPHRGIGIHGTHAPESIGTRATEGCIRLRNADLDSLKPLVRVGMPVAILPSDADREADAEQ